MNKKLSIIIGGDIVPTKSNLQYFESGNIESIIDKDIREILSNADIRIFNIETPICDERTPIEKEGPCFSTSRKSVNGIKALNPTLVTLANNHILDQGLSGLKSTIEILNKKKISFTGIGKNYIDANKAFYIEKNGLRIGIYGCTEHEYSVATNKFPGATPFEALDIVDTIREIKTSCDCLIILYHGGKEYYEYPSPELQKRCHKMIKAGADFIICQHSHCIGTLENYMNGKILYGQGNFILDRYIKAYEKYFQSSLLVRIDICEGEFNWEMIPIKKEGCGIRIASNEEAKPILESMHIRKLQITDVDFVEKKYKEYVNTVAFRWIIRLSRFGYIVSFIDNKFLKGKLLNRDLKRILGKHQRLAIENCLQCEVHNEILRAYLQNRRM